MFIGEEKLKKQERTGFPKGVTKICDGVYFALGYGGSTCTLVVGEESCVLVDTLNGTAPAREVREEFKKITDKPVRAIIYTHYHHFDHTSGASVFADEHTRIIGRKPSYPQYGKSGMLKDICGIRGARQFGAGLTAEEVICVGIGPRNEINGEKGSLGCTELFEEEELTLDLDGIEVKLTAAPGETDDQIFVWFPQHQVLCCGDNYYESWPNLYAIRGGQYRDVHAWIRSLDQMRACSAEYLLPGHTRAVIGREQVSEVLKNYRDALEYVLDETLAGMNQGMTPDELVDVVKLPKRLAKLPYLQEYYGTVEWSVRAIYSGYLGWFDGNPTHLGHLPRQVRAEKMIRLMGGEKEVLKEAKEAVEGRDCKAAMESQEPVESQEPAKTGKVEDVMESQESRHAKEVQWAVELCDLLLDAGKCLEEARLLKAEGLVFLGRMQTSANARHYYLACARQLRGQGEEVKLNGAMNDVDKKEQDKKEQDKKEQDNRERDQREQDKKARG